MIEHEDVTRNDRMFLQVSKEQASALMTTLTRLPDHPGIHDAYTTERPYFERAYQAPHSEIIRVRYTPVSTDTGMTANIPLMPRMVAMMASASEVDAEGQVILINGRGRSCRAAWRAASTPSNSC